MRAMTGWSDLALRSRRWRHRLPRRPGRRGAAMLIGLAALLVAAGLLVPRHAPALMAETQLSAALDRTLVRLGLRVERVTVSGRHWTSADDLRAAIGVERGDAILRVAPRAARQRIEALDWVAEARVERLLPDRLHISIVERQPFALWQRREQLVLIDATGAPIAKANVAAFAHLPLVVGDGAAAQAAQLVALLEAAPALAARVEAAVRVGERRWDLHFHGGVVLRLPEEGVAEAWRRFAEMDHAHHLLARDIAVIDLRLRDRWAVRLRSMEGWRQDGKET